MPRRKTSKEWANGADDDEPPVVYDEAKIDSMLKNWAQRGREESSPQQRKASLLALQSLTHQVLLVLVNQ